MKDSTLVGVYGSLRKGLSNHHYLQNAEFVSTTELPAVYSMVSLGGFPGVMEGGDTKIMLEMYRVTPDELANLDSLESNESFYTRKEVDTLGGSTPWVYFLPREKWIDNEPVPSGDWKLFLEHRYA